MFVALVEKYMATKKGNFFKNYLSCADSISVWRRVRILPPKSLRVVRGDGKGTQ
jgi:hypothetical protein